MKRKDILEKALEIVQKDRQSTYGTPEDNFTCIANLWGSYLDKAISPTDVAVLMVLLKIARAKHNQHYEDNWIDIAGYAACAGELNDDKA